MNSVLCKKKKKKAKASLRNIFPATFFSYKRDYVSKLGAVPGGLKNWQRIPVASLRNFKVITTDLL